MALSVVSLNFNGLHNADTRGGVLQWVRSLPTIPDIVCLQEVHCTSSAECHSWFLSSGFSCVASPGSVKSCGCAVLFRPTVPLVSSCSDNEGPFLFANVLFGTFVLGSPV